MSINPFVQLSFSKYNYSDRMRGHFGGEKTFIDPYTTGYHMCFFTLPDALSTEYGTFLTTVCQAVTIPGYTVQPIEYIGLNGKKWYVPGLTQIDNQVITCTFTEMANIPISQIVGQWVSIFRNPLYGISDPSLTDSYSQGNYKGSMTYATTLPDGKTVQYAATFMGIFPTKIPTDRFGSNRENQEKVELEVEFSFDDMFTGENVISAAQSLVSNVQSAAVDATDSIYNAEVSDSSSV